MQLGITWTANNPENDAWAAEHRPQWNKSGFSPDETGTNYTAAARWAGHVHAVLPDCKCIADLRTVSVQEFLAHPARPSGGGVYDWFVDWVGGVVEETAGAIKYWEIWGEAACPYTGKGFVEAGGSKPYEGMTYLELLKQCYERIKSVDPEARVLLGGHGCDMFLRFYKEVMEAGAGQFFDVNALHCYLLKWRTWETIEPVLLEGFKEMRRIAHSMPAFMAEYPVDEWTGIPDGFFAHHPLCITEFGWPTTPGGREWTAEELGSEVLESVLSVSEDQAADWTEKCFRLFEEAGVQVLIYTGLLETGGGSHWGKHLGIIRPDGTRKGRLYEVVVEWIRRGRETEVTL